MVNYGADEIFKVGSTDVQDEDIELLIKRGLLGKLGVGRIDPRQRLAGADPLPQFDRARDDSPARAECQLTLYAWAQAAEQHALVRSVVQLDRGHEDAQRRGGWRWRL
jgi:hypothetical protein